MAAGTQHMEDHAGGTVPSFPRPRRYADHELDSMDHVPLPRLNPWLTLALLVLGGFAYVWLWGVALGG